jgi:conjugative relaxase-like TrwC/TraI family protein
VLTIGKMSPEGAIAYYTKDNYYQQASAIDSSEWWGAGAEEFGLSGAIADLDVFANLCNGYDPTGTEQLRLPPKNKKVIPSSSDNDCPLTPAEQEQREKDAEFQKQVIGGYDTTFSAPKSVSLACLVGGDEGLAEDHKASVKVALEMMNQYYFKTRIKGEMVQGFKPIVALFDHDTSRELDPQLHTHSFWMNLAQTADGKWQSMTAQDFYKYKILMGQVYRNELARRCELRGYQIEHRADGLFELAGYSRDQILQFSERHNQILGELERLGLPDTTANRIKALFNTRKPKTHDFDREALKASWGREIERLGIAHPVPSESIANKIDLEQVIGQALRHCEERRSVFPIEDVQKFVTEIPTGHTIEAINEAIAHHPDTIHKKDSDRRELATEFSLERERLTIAIMREGKGKMVPLGELIHSEKLSKYQLAGVNLALTCPDQMIAWKGVAGAGKTFTVSELLEVLDGAVHVVGLAPDASSAQVLATETGIKAKTAASWLLEPTRKSRQLLILDEAGKLSAAEAYDIAVKVKEGNVQLLMVGDRKQLSAVNAGSPFKALCEAGMAQADLKDFFRQKDPELNLAVQMMYHNWGQQALSILNEKGWIEEHKDFDEKLQAIAAQWEIEGGDTRILAGTHSEREALTEILRARLKQKGEISQTDHTARIFKAKGLTVEQCQHARFYEVGDIVVSDKDSNGLRGARQYRVKAVEGDIVTLYAVSHTQTLDMKTLKKPMNVRVYQEQSIAITVGDRLQWTQNNYRLGRVNGQETTVTWIENDIVTLRSDDGKINQVSLKQLNHLNHGLVRTIYSSQGMTCDRVLVAIGLGQEVSREAILVAMSRARHEARFYCANKSTLFERLNHSSAQPNIQDWLKVKGFRLKAPKPPSHIDLAHWKERIEGSSIAPRVAALNVQSIEDEGIYERLLATRMDKMGSGQFVTRPMVRLKNAYNGVAEGGAWNLGGINATCLENLKPGERPVYKTWGELKPDNPRIDSEKTLKKGKKTFRKYEAPLDEPKGIFFPEVPPELADRIYERYGVNPTPLERESGFWPCVYWYPQIEIHVVEGKKKAEADVTQAYAAVGLPSITGGYRAKDAEGNRLASRVLHAELAPFAKHGRPIAIAFDKDLNPQTVKDARRDMVRTGELFEAAGSPVRSIHWEQKDGKGVDDYIKQSGVEAWHERVDEAVSLSWEARVHYENEYGKLANWVQKQNGKAPDAEKLDVAVALYADRQDVAKILTHGSVAKTLPPEQRQGYIEAIVLKARELEVKLRMRPKLREIERELLQKSPVVRRMGR